MASSKYNLCFRRDRGYRSLTDFEERDEQLLFLAVKGTIIHGLYENLDVVNNLYRCFIFQKHSFKYLFTGTERISTLLVKDSVKNRSMFELHSEAWTNFIKCFTFGS